MNQRPSKDIHRFDDIAARVRADDPLGLEDGVFLYRYPDLLAVGALANEVRERLHGDDTFFNVNFHINPTNVCVADCKFCSFARLEPDAPAAYTMSVDEVRQKLLDRENQPVTEIHIVNGLHHDLPFSYYLDLLRALKQIRPDIHLKAYTAVEIHYFAEKFGQELRAGTHAAARGRSGQPARRRRGDLRGASAPQDLSRQGRRGPVVGRCTAPRTSWASAPTARCSTARSRPSKSGSTTCCACARCRPTPAASRPSSRSPFTPTATRWPSSRPRPGSMTFAPTRSPA
jgi:hypothetical protein